MATAESGQSSTSLPTSFKLSSHLGVHLNVALVDLPPETTAELVEEGQSQRTSAADFLSIEPCERRLVILGTVALPDGSTVPLNERCLNAITLPMLEDINSLRSAWLNVSDLHARPSSEKGALSYASQVEGIDAAVQHAVTITLVPVGIPTDLLSNRRSRVRLEWVDARQEHSVPLADLFQSPTLPLHLRDLVSQLTSRLLADILLRESASAKLYHRSWQDRQRDAVPLINSIASSMRSLLSHTSEPAKLESYLQQLQLSQSLPSIITITNLLTELDMTCHSPSAPTSTAAVRKRSQLDQSCRALISCVDLASDREDSDFGWIDAGQAPSSSDDRQEDERGDTDSLASYAPDLDKDENDADTDAAWADILQFCQEALPVGDNENRPGRVKIQNDPLEAHQDFIKLELCDRLQNAQHTFRSQYLSAQARF